MHWDQTTGLLYISSSAKGPFDRLAKAVGGETARRVEGEEVFRSLHGFKRLILRNLGLTHHQGRGVRYSMYMGVDVADGLDSAKSQSRIKNNIFATGFLDGMPASRGCSAKGKFWSSAKVRDLTDWVDWCQDVGRTVNDPASPPTVSSKAPCAHARSASDLTCRPSQFTGPNVDHADRGEDRDIVRR